MKTLLFCYLNSFGLVLVLTQTRQPYLGPLTTGCKLTKAGREYAGPLNVTRSGLTCQRWDSKRSYFKNFKNSTRFPEGSASAAGNKCRNPDVNYKGVWCYTTDPNVRWEECNVPFCDCKLTKAGRDYAGALNVTRSGLTCQRWDSKRSYFKNLKNSTRFPEGSASAAGNKCRNPDVNYKGVWCYTTDPNIKWEECNVPFCDHETTDTGSVTESSGTSDGTSSSQWQIILLLVFAGLLILTTGIILCLCRKRFTAGNKEATITKNTAIPHHNSIYEDICYDTIDVHLNNVVSRETPTLRGNTVDEYGGSRSMDLPSEEVRIPMVRNHSTEKSREGNAFLDLTPERVLPPVYAVYLDLRN